MKEARHSFLTLSVFITISLTIYSWALHTLAQEENRLVQSCAILNEKKALIETSNEKMREKLRNIKDPSCEEFLLRHYLGLCPRDALEIRFEDE